MKKVFHLQMIIVLTIILTAFSCSKSDENSADTFYFKATINGTKTNATTHFATIGEIDGKSTLFLYGRWGEKNIYGIDFQVLDFSKTQGEYSIENNNTIVKASYRTDKKLFNASKGKLVIESITDKTIKGTFEFTSDDATISEGTFYLPIQNVGSANTPDVDSEIKGILSEINPETIARLKEGGMAIHEGNTPPLIEGIYLSSPHILMQPYPGDTRRKGHLWNDYRYRISTQKNGHAVLDFKAADANGSGIGIYLTGSGNKFTLYARVFGQERGVNKTDITVISGEITPEGIKNFTSSYVLAWKEGDSSNNILMPIGAHRVSGDQDRLAQKISTY